MWTQLKDKWVKARKPHQCWGCLRVFPKGTRLRYVTGVMDGDFHATYACKSCDELWFKHVLEDICHGDGVAEGWAMEYWAVYDRICRKFNDEEGRALALKWGGVENQKDDTCDTPAEK